MTQSILVIASHADDETIGCAGTILRHISEGDEVSMITMTNGTSARANSTKRDLDLRKKNAKAAISYLGINWIAEGNFPDNSMDTVPLLSIIHFLEKEIDQINPDIIYTHSLSDLNIDHKITAHAVLTTFRPEPESTFSEIRLFEVPSSTDFSVPQMAGNFEPNLFIDIEKYWEGKMKALQYYKDEIKPYPHSRSLRKIENLAELRGGQSGLVKAEAFEVIRKIYR